MDNPGAWAPSLLKTPGTSNVNPVTVASAASLANASTSFLTVVSGTNAMTGVQLPSGFKGMFVLLPTAASTGVTGGTFADDGTTASVPFKIAFTNVAGRAQVMFCDGNFVYPSYT